MKRFILFVFLSVSAASLLSAAEVAQAAQGIAYYKAGFAQVAKPLLIKENATDTLTRAETSFFLGNIYFEENKLDSAAFYFKKGVNIRRPNNFNIIGLTMLKMKSNPKEANQELQNLTKFPPNRKNIDFFIAVGRAYLYNGLFDEASEYLEKAKAIKVKYSGVAVLAGDIMFAKKDIGQACSNYELAILYDPNCKEAYIKYARAYKAVNPTLAIEKLNELKAKEPSFLLAERELGDTYYATNDYKKATQAYDNYLKSGNTGIGDFVNYAYSVLQSKDNVKALEVSILGLQKAPRNPVLARIALFSSVSLEKYDDALKYGDMLFNKSEKPILAYYDFANYATALSAKKQYDLAIELYKKAYTVDSSQVAIFNEMSDIYDAKEDYTNSIAAYKKFLSLKSDDKITSDMIMVLAKKYYNLGSQESMLSDAKKAALLTADSLFAKVAALEPTNYRGNRYRAVTNFLLDPESKTDVAKGFYDQTLALVESKADAKYNPIIIECSRFLAAYYFLKKDYVKSKTYWVKILSIDPKNEQALKLVDAIDKAQKGKK
jgi:tetratricopeptide (TPR) repeat protein